MMAGCIQSEDRSPFGTRAGLSAQVDQEASRFWSALLSAAGVQSDRCGKLPRRRRVLGDTEAWFLINPPKDDAIEEIGLEGFSDARSTHRRAA